MVPQKGVKGSVVVLFTMFAGQPIPLPLGVAKRGEFQSELLQAGKKGLQFLFALPNCFSTRNIINI